MSYRLVLPFADVGDGITPADGAKLYVFEPGTVTPKDSYSDFALTTVNSHPVVADSEGVFGDIFLDTQADIRLDDKNDVPIWGPDRLYPPGDSISSADIAQAIFPQTASELAQGVTPVDYTYPAGNVLRYGNNTTPGTTDMTTALDNAIKSNEEVIIPGEVFLISATITVTNANVLIRGEGASSIVRANAATFNLFTVNADDVQFDRVNFQGAASDDTTGQYGIFTATATPALRLSITNCWFGGSGASARLNNGIKLDADCDDAYITGNYIDQMAGNISGTGYGVLCGAVDHCIINENRFIATATNGRHAVYLSTGAQYCVVSNNACEDYVHQHIALNAATAQADNAYNIIEGNVCDGGMTNASTGQIAIFGRSNGNKIIGNQLVNSGENGIVLNNRFDDATDQTSANNEIINNTIIGCGTIGIDLFGTTSTTIQGNTITDCSQDSSGTSAAIRLRASAASGQACTNCSIVANTVAGTDHRSALQFNATSPVPTGTRVRGNSFAPGASFTIETNAVAYDGNNSGTSTISSGTTSTVITHLLGVTPTLDQITVTLGEAATSTPGAIWVDTITSTQFTVNCENDPGASNLDFAWRYHPVE